MATRLVFSGRVQGVSLRAHIEHVARELRLSGYVKNLEDSDVEVVVEGPEEKITKLIESVKHYTYVSDVKKAHSDEECGTFRITY